MKSLKGIIILLFLLQILLVMWGTNIFTIEANPIALLVITCLLLWYSFRAFYSATPPATHPPQKPQTPWLHALIGVLGIATAYEELRKIWLKYPTPETISDVLPQLKGQCALFFSGQFPYQPIPQPGHNPFPVYMPLHWSPIQLSNAMHIDARWSAIIMLLLAVGIAGYWLSKSHPQASVRATLPAMLLFALPLWAFVVWGKIDLAVSLEGVVTAWYILLAAGFAARNYPLIIIGLTGALLSRYTLMFWTIPFAVLLWLNAPKKHSFLVWGTVATAILTLFVIPFWMKDFSIVSKILAYYNAASERTWLYPDEYSFKDGLSLNIHLRKLLPGTPEANFGIRNLPQIFVQFLLAGGSIYFYQKRWKNHIDVYTFSLMLLVLMTLALYSFSPMLFRYYLLMPVSITAVLCWKVLSTPKTRPAEQP